MQNILIEEHQDIAKKIIKQGAQKIIQLHAPSSMLFELNNCFIKEELEVGEVKRHFSMLHKFINKKVIKITSHPQRLLAKAFELASLDTQGQGYISIYDATFHALAKIENATLLTADKKHYRKTKDLVGSIALLEDWRSPG